MTRRGFTFMPSAYTAWKRDFIRLLGWQTSRKPIQGVLSVFLELGVSIPKSYSKRERDDALGGLVVPSGDIDNHVKSVLDAMTEAGVWVDDRQVGMLTARKRYAASDYVRVRVELLESFEQRDGHVENLNDDVQGNRSREQ